MNGIVNEGNDTVLKRTLIPSFNKKTRFKRQLNDMIDVVFVRKTKVITDAFNDHLCPKKWFNFTNIINGYTMNREIRGIGSKNNTTIKITYEKTYKNPSFNKNDYYEVMCFLVRTAEKSCAS